MTRTLLRNGNPTLFYHPLHHTGTSKSCADFLFLCPECTYLSLKTVKVIYSAKSFYTPGKFSIFLLSHTTSTLYTYMLQVVQRFVSMVVFPTTPKVLPQWAHFISIFCIFCTWTSTWHATLSVTWWINEWTKMDKGIWQNKVKADAYSVLIWWATWYLWGRINL